MEYNKIEEKMTKTISVFEENLSEIRAGRANPAILNKVMIDYYGTPTPINQVAGISVPEARMIVIQPWDASILKDIEKEILKSDIGINPNNDGKVIRLAFPELNEERRKEIVKDIRKMAEEAKVAIRSIRRDGIDEAKTMQKNSEISEDDLKVAEEKIQKLTDKYVENIDNILETKEKGIETKLGHKAGAENLERLANFANDIGLKYLTVYAFSTENWKRTKEEVGALMVLLKSYVDKFLKRANTNNIKIRVLGDLERLDSGLRESIAEIVEKSSNNTGLTLNIAFNYGGRDEITNAVKHIAKDVENGKMKIDEIDEQVISNKLYTCGEPDPDLLIRTGGELRISNFLLWQLAYTEFLFVDKYWPDFSEEDLLNAIHTFQTRKRRFGGK